MGVYKIVASGLACGVAAFVAQSSVEPRHRPPGQATLLTGRVEAPSGSVVGGALVTAHLADGRTVTVYSAADGGFVLPTVASGAERVEAQLPGVGRVSRGGVSHGETLRLVADEDPIPPASAWLAELPTGEDTRRFIVDCTGCHVTDASRLEVDGVRRTASQWGDAIRLMTANFGPGSGFPIISAWADPETLGPWAALHFGDAVPRAPVVRGPAPEPGSTGVVLTEYPVPEPQDLPHDLMVDGEGSVWVTGMFTHRMYRLDPATGAFGTVPIPVEGANPRALDIDASGRIWVVLGAPGRLAVFDPTRDEWDVHDVGMYAHSVAVGSDGRGWVNGHFTADPEVVASVDPVSGAVDRYEVPHAEGGSESTIPYGLRVDRNGIVWGTQLRGNRLVRIDPTDGSVRQWPMPVSHSGPRRPDAAPDGAIWIPLYSANALARFDPASETFRVWDFPVPGALPYVVRVNGVNGTVWIGTGHGDVAASFDPRREEFTLYPLPTRGALVRHLDVDEARNEVWFAYGASPGIPGEILRIRVPAGGGES